MTSPADDRPVVVGGAAGKTGRAVCSGLLARGVAVRGVVRPGREAAAAAGTEAVAVDLATGAGLAAALDGARAAYHLAPNVHPDEVGMARRAARAAAAVGLPHLVFHSVLRPHDARMPHHLRKGEAEAVLRAGIPGSLVVLRPASYQENLLPQVVAGEVVVPYAPEQPFSAVALADVAEAAATALLEPERAAGEHDLTGPEALSTHAMAAQAARVLGRPVRVRRVRADAWAAGPGAALPEDARALLLAMFAAYDEDGLVGDPADLTRLLGRPPTSWRDTVTRASAASRAEPVGDTS
ncbi:NmrA family NAD(P)-binding protein [Phycicoccus duodecadis]|uniref:Uncharacterized protein YbjT (DUF2867 family) n=1 Tax=Phycicoccus duodecadis TaxID=173053 RepID=A0A2N3YKG0_9MICO|nr:NmrA family NAD(P)-binding protein [Phycicoccus duodecadis]PKW27343.1 uncharacterized protein YbjT (DUF2867 family) [Phycicoccus duodecadis]